MYAHVVGSVCAGGVRGESRRLGAVRLAVRGRRRGPQDQPDAGREGSARRVPREGQLNRAADLRVRPAGAREARAREEGLLGVRQRGETRERVTRQQSHRRVQLDQNQSASVLYSNCTSVED